MFSNHRILVAEDEPEVRRYLEVALRHHGFTPEFAADGEEAIASLQQEESQFVAAIVDVVMPRMDGLETLRKLRRMRPALPVIMLSATASTTHVIDAMKAGASDFLSKPVGFEELGDAIQAVIKKHAAPLSQAATPESCGIVPARSTWGVKIERFLEIAGPSELPVLLRGETGVGKEVVARQLHARSPRADKPFLKVNCAALPSELVESELFGYERGAFTGAVKSSIGRFKQAQGGTIFLDEIGDMDFKLQAKLLQVLQDQEFLRIGSAEPTKVDVRIMAATHCDLERAIHENRFREDLYYRLDVVSIKLPGLRERREDILPLANEFLAKHGAGGRVPEFTPTLIQALLDHDWPGNIRELENLMRKFLVFQDADLICERLQRSRRRGQPANYIAEQATFEDAPREDDDWAFPAERAAEPLQRPIPIKPAGYSSRMSWPAPSAVPVDMPPEPDVLHRVAEMKRNAESSAILSALRTTRWNRRQAAALLKIDYKALLYKMKKLGIGASDDTDVLKSAQMHAAAGAR